MHQSSSRCFENDGWDANFLRFRPSTDEIRGVSKGLVVGGNGVPARMKLELTHTGPQVILFT